MEEALKNFKDAGTQLEKLVKEISGADSNRLNGILAEIRKTAGYVVVLENKVFKEAQVLATKRRAELQAQATSAVESVKSTISNDEEVTVEKVKVKSASRKK